MVAVSLSITWRSGEGDVYDYDVCWWFGRGYGGGVVLLVVGGCC